MDVMGLTENEREIADKYIKNKKLKSVIEEIKKKEFIKSIKLFLEIERKGSGLKESKEACDLIRARLRELKKL